jgi:hypothetical protein
MANSGKRRNLGIRRVKPKGKSEFGKPDLSVYIGKNTKRIHVDIRLTAAEERGLYNELRKRHPTWE